MTEARGSDPFIGREILGGEFRILQRIGTGGMGSVYKAEQPEMSRMVAIKILHPKLTNRQDLVARFRREARAMAQLSHPNTVKVFNYGELDDGSLYIVMEFLEGRNLNRAVKREGPMTVDRAIPILIQVCGALQEAHQMGIIHRDLKPENIFLSKQMGMDEYPKVLDFGLAKVTEQQMRPGSVNLTQEGMVFGTPEFMSPEQAQGQTLEATSDIYSLAVILYEALTGKLPFDARSPMEFIQKHVVDPPIPLSERVPGLKFPKGLDDVIGKALEKEPGRRYQSAIEFAAALRPFAGESAALVDGIFHLTPAPPSTAVVSSKASAVAAQKVSGPSVTLLATVAVVCLVFGVVLAVAIMKILGH
ncbi:MAG TPA: serine/threonine-protein kinase [Polyangiaceae bacterium]|nr:serine/threonine-protein kinase [Polyangiaceae bacterium]